MADNITCDELVPTLIKDFGSLWQCHRRGETLEVVTPFSTATQRFVSVFIRRREDGFIISDGGWLSEGTYRKHDPEQVSETPDALVEFFSSSLGIISTETGDRKIFFKKCSQLSLLSSAVYDVANFLVNVVSTESFVTRKEEDSDAREFFQTRANSFLANHYDRGDVKLRHRFDDLHGVVFNAVIERRSEISIIAYVTGSTDHYFAGDVRKAIVNFELSAKTKYRDHIKRRLSLVDDEAAGYSPNRLDAIMGLMREKTTHDPVLWTNKDALLGMIE